MKTWIKIVFVLKKWPFFDWYPHWVYFRIFRKEYFHVISLDGDN
ncbi:MAG TPA: hypothetical protein VGD65_23055 [Chryseosolibacter sp.]